MWEFQPKELICLIVKIIAIVRSLIGTKNHLNNKNSACNSETFRGNFKEFHPTVGSQLIRISKLSPFCEELEVKLNLIPSSSDFFANHQEGEVCARSAHMVWNFTHAQIVILANSYSVTNVV